PGHDDTVRGHRHHIALRDAVHQQLQILHVVHAGECFEHRRDVRQVDVPTEWPTRTTWATGQRLEEGVQRLPHGHADRSGQARVARRDDRRYPNWQVGGAGDEQAGERRWGTLLHVVVHLAP